MKKKRKYIIIFGPLVKKNCLILNSASEDGMVQKSSKIEKVKAKNYEKRE